MATELPPPPVIENEPTEVADGVFVIPDGRVPLVPNVGIVLGDDTALVVDTAMGPRNGARIQFGEQFFDYNRLDRCRSSGVGRLKRRGRR